MIMSQSDSLFTYPPYTNLSSFSNSSYQPLFDHEPSPNVLAICGDDPFCVFDYTVTGDRSFAEATLAVVREATGFMELVAPGEDGVGG
jgi:hypothetical protein